VTLAAVADSLAVKVRASYWWRPSLSRGREPIRDFGQRQAFIPAQTRI